MLIKQKTQYALRAIYELARCKGQGPIKVAKVAHAQDIPIRFLEVILNQLKKSGLVISKRGYLGGYEFIGEAGEITVGDIVRFMQNLEGPVHCNTDASTFGCTQKGKCPFLPMWQEVHSAVCAVYDATTIQALLDQAKDLENHKGS